MKQGINMVDRIVGLYDWHDGGYCVFEDGKVKEHIEFERYTRVKESGGNSLDYLKEHYLDKNGLTLEDIDKFVSVYPVNNLKVLPDAEVSYYPHHFCHAAHAYYSSNFDDAFILTLDSEGHEDEGPMSTCGYYASGTEIKRLFAVPNSFTSLGRLWGRLTRYVFKLSAGFPRGHQAGSVMAMAALGSSDKYYDDIYAMATEKFDLVKDNPPGAKRGVYVPPEEEVIHPYLNKYRELAESSDQEKYDLAASLQKVTEDIISDFIVMLLESGFESRNICFGGGVSLNSVSLGKLVSEYSDVFDNFFVPPVPYDGGHTIGACQHYWHSVLGNPKVDHFESPYLGEKYSKSDVKKSLKKFSKKIDIIDDVSLDECVDLLADDKIVAVFQGRSESGRRALGNRSILASPISFEMKDLINEKVKHRQSYRPFAPSILEEFAEDWFVDVFPSPYMSFVFHFKIDKLAQAPAVEHFDGTARLHTVSEKDNKWYHGFISKWFKKSGVPIVLNTSFNDREPIVETPEHAINCFMGTNIDYLYFFDVGLLIRKNIEE